MASPVNMPQVGQDLETARIVEWHVKEGDQVKTGDILATVESDKASFEVEAFGEGTVLKLIYAEGEEGQVFKPIAYLGNPGETIPGVDEKPPELHSITTKPEVEENKIDNERRTGKIFSSPSARRVAREQNIDISLVEPSGPDNRIIKKDVLAYAAAVKHIKATPVAREIAIAEGMNLEELSGTGPGGRIHKNDVLNAARKRSIPVNISDEDEVVKFDKVRRVIADRLSVSKLTIPHYYLNTEVEVENALRLKEKLQNEPGVKVSFNDILVWTVAKLLPRYRFLNAHVDSEKIVIKPNVNIGVAVSTEAGLFVPVLPQAHKMNLLQISKEIRKLADDAKRGIVNPVNQGTFTISNLGMFGISGFQAIINPPECAILSVGSIEKKVIPTETGLRITDMLNIGMAVDHRAVDGAYAAKFLQEFKAELMNIKL